MLDYRELELRLLWYHLGKGEIPCLHGWLGREEPYKSLDPSNPRDIPILARWQQAKMIRVVVRLQKRDYLPAIDTEQLIHACEEYHIRQLEKATRLEQEAALLFEMRPQPLNIQV